MVEWRKKSRRKSTGGINNATNRKTKSLSDRGGSFSKTIVDSKDKRYKEKTRGGTETVKIAKATTAIIAQGNTSKKAKIINVVENKANKHFVRQKLITKGAIITIKLDDKEVKAKVTSRPGQSGQVSAVLVK